ITQAAFSIYASFPYFPRGTVHLVVVDPGVGSRRAVIALAMQGHFFLAPDNGVLTLLLKAGPADAIIRVENSKFFLPSVSATFHGRDILAPVGAHVVRGVELKKLGTRLALDDVVCLPDICARIAENGELRGAVIASDRFGNLITNIDSKILARYCEGRKPATPRIKIGRRVLVGLVANYESVRPGDPLALIGSRGYLEIAVNRGSACHHFKAGKGAPVRVSV
ncbi:MAG: SAM-dependent chlorinase/fluorinase, partial [Desulfobacterales bacterium]